MICLHVRIWISCWVRALRTQTSCPGRVRERALSALTMAIKGGHVLAIGNCKDGAIGANLHRAMRRMQSRSTQKPAAPSIISSEGFAKVSQTLHRRVTMMCGERFARESRMVHRRVMMMCSERFARRGRMLHRQKKPWNSHCQPWNSLHQDLNPAIRTPEL
jgi:hypothetical protein